MQQPSANTAPTVRQVSVSADEAGQRIDNFLARYLKGVPRSRIYRMLRRGEVRVNSGRIRARYKVRAGDTIRIPPVRISAAGTLTPGSAVDLEGRIVFENARCLIIDKPSGIAVHGGSGLDYGVIEALRAGRPGEPYLELAHRLDRDTSGCLVIAKRRSFLRAFHEQLRGGMVTKRYLALLAGRWEGGSRTVSVPLRKNHLRSGERMVIVDDGGKAATTLFRPVSRYATTVLVEVDLKTGRTHQIRVHAAHIGHPLAGDGKYGDPAFNRRMRETGLRRLFLHAHMIEFTDAPAGEPISVSLPLEAGLQAVIDRLETA
ncbi:MAG: RluA family pseudouridine synthase [Gammaproteobacteria bacterium]|jgi:23S rRNA pseudouridine955/2504/2580 synthase